MSKPSTPKKRTPRKKVISSRWVVPPSEQSEGMVEQNGTSSSKKTFRACRCQAASPNSQVPSRCQCMQNKEHQGTMAKTTKPLGHTQMKQGTMFATKPVPLDISATSSEATTNSYSLYDVPTEQLKGKTRGQMEASEYETDTETETEPTMESHPTKKGATISRPSSSQGKRLSDTPKIIRNRADPLTHNHKLFAPRKNVKSKRKSTNQDEEVMETTDDVEKIDIEDGDLTEEEIEMIRLRSKATLMKLCMESCTKPSYKKKGGSYDGKYSNIDDMVAKWKSEPGKMMIDGESTPSESDDQMTNSVDNEPMLERSVIRKRLTRTENENGGYEGRRYPEKDDCRTCIPRQRVIRKHQMRKDAPQPEFLQTTPDGANMNVKRNMPVHKTIQEPMAESRKKANPQKPVAGKIYSQTPRNGSAARNSMMSHEEEKEIYENKEERWCEQKCKQIAWGTEVNEREAKEALMALGKYVDSSDSIEENLDDTRQQEMMVQEPEMTSARNTERNETQDDEENIDEEYSLWCDKTCETIARLPEMWTAPDPTGIIVRVLGKGEKYDPKGESATENEPEFASAPNRNRQIAKELADWHRSQLGQETENWEMSPQQKEYKIQKMIQMCRKLCIDQPKKTENTGKKVLSQQQGGKTPNLRAKKKAMEEDAEELERKENEVKEYEMNKMKLRENIIKVCMERCNKVMTDGAGGQGPQENRPHPQMVSEPAMTSEPRRGYLPQDSGTAAAVREGSKLQPAELCEGMRSVCEKLADELVEQHYQYGPAMPGYSLDNVNLGGNGGTNDAQEPKFESRNRRQPKTPAYRTGSKSKLKEDSEPKYKTVKQNLSLLRTKISRGSTEEAADTMAQKASLGELSSSSRLTVARRVRPKREPAHLQNRIDKQAKDPSDTSVNAPSEDSREDFYQALEETEDPGAARTNDEALFHQTRSPQNRNQQQLQPEDRSQVPAKSQQPGYRERISPIEQGPVYQEKPSTIKPQPNYREQTSPYKPQPDYQEQSSLNTPQPHREQISPNKPTSQQPAIPKQKVSTYTQTSQPDQQTSVKQQPDYREQTTYKQQFHYQEQTLPRMSKDSSAQTVNGPQQGPGTAANRQTERLVDVSETVSLSVTSSRVMFAEKPITMPPAISPRSMSPSAASLLSRCGSNESCNTCGHAKSRPKRGCLKCPVSSERRNFSKNIYLEEQELSKLRDSASRSRSMSPPQSEDLRTINDPNLLKGMREDGSYSFVHRHKDTSDISIERSHHSLTICAQADARQRLIDRYMIDILGLRGIEPVVVEKTIDGCTWGVRAYRMQ